jgi:hypothetical protein
VKIDYKSSCAFVRYEYEQTADKLVIKLTGSYEYVQLSLPVPGNYVAGDLTFSGRKKKYIMASINQSNYLIADADVKGECEIILNLKKKH